MNRPRGLRPNLSMPCLYCEKRNRKSPRSGLYAQKYGYKSKSSLLFKRKVPAGFKVYDAATPYAESKTYSITADSITANSLVLSWEKALDDPTPQALLTYKVVQSTINNIGTLEGVLANGTTVMDWTADVSRMTS
jgi:hypothetical protein